MIELQWWHMHDMSSHVLVEQEAVRLTGKPVSKWLRCRMCRGYLIGRGDNVVAADGRVVLVRIGYTFPSEFEVGVEILGSQIMRRDFTAVCPKCDEETKVFVR